MYSLFLVIWIDITGDDFLFVVVGLGNPGKEYTNTSADLDKSFFTNSMKFKNEDFDQLSYINKNLKKNNLLIKILLLIIFIGIASGIIILVFNLLK